MYLTESEATRKLCPQTAHEGVFDPCCTSSCMWWRWQEGRAPNDPIRELGDGKVIGYVQPDKAKGFCGLAGKPE